MKENRGEHVLKEDINDRNIENRKRDALSEIHHFIDVNLRGIQNSLYVLGGLSMVMLSRKLYMTKIFSTVNDIPSHFIEKQVRLLGKVKHIAENGVLNIEHIPIIMLRIPFLHREPVLLPVHLACVDVSPEGQAWLKRIVYNRKVWFCLLYQTAHDNETKLYAKVSVIQPFWRNIKVNEELVKCGLCKISDISSLLDTSGTILSNKNAMQFIDQLVRLENKAAAKGTGMWRQSEESKWKRKTLEAVKIIVTGPFSIIKWIYKKSRRKS